MPVFQYTATDQTGASSQGNFEAESEEQARSQLAQYGLNVTELVALGDGPSEGQEAVPEKNKKKKKGLMAMQFGGGPSNEDISVFTRQMSTLVQAGLPLLRSLEVMIKQQRKKPKFKAMLENISEKVSSGGIFRMVWPCIRRPLTTCSSTWSRQGKREGCSSLSSTGLPNFRKNQSERSKK